MLIKYIVFVCIYILLYEVNCIDKKQEPKDVFVPTKEWQVVPKGQPIPKGLHVRINFATGLTEAKLLDENESAKKDQALTHIPDQYENLDDKAIKKSTLEESLKNIKSDEILKPDQIKNIKNKFKSYETMKKNLADLHLTPKIGSEVLQDMMRTFREETQNKNVNLKEIVRIIQDFRFLAHQYDNAIDFVTLNGFQEVIYTNLNSSTTNVRIEILRLLSSLVQNNPKVQIHALETGSVGVLLRILSTDPDVQVKKATATAVSCLLRRFPLAQLKFIEHGGIAIVASIFEKNYIEAQVKFATLMSDLLLEKRHAVEQAEFYQYKLVNLEGLLVLHNWCESLSKLLSNVLRVDPTDHDSIEKCLSAMFTFRDRCGAQYDAEILTSLQSTYSILVLSEAQLDAEDEFGNNIFYTNLHDLSGELLKSTAQTKPKTEL